ncbi:MAG: hypothetical protein ACREE0_11660 [Phenylobacterium sp.]
MTSYRLYFVDLADHIQNAAEFVAESDEDALLAAVDQRDGRAMELWSGVRVVARFTRPADS